ncbi:ATP-binding protein involved in chromosome partitioning [Hasllibacter halocynthiae]|uniref:Iron-sulfur cluster carrier protein n=1 Tax=Hasllibacter halocynthiae TaxID=595589 RepID=A0A2T0X7A8_9RHOB|nr:Mrp/NBP35 family ATP-binding protein [Hasllibacter halocynthiae]PRY94816.1 ATP-binding protein involved in chromosome partitioning [Hasllibacter halocynthiae]
MTDRTAVENALAGIPLPGGGSLAGADLVRALRVEPGEAGTRVSFVIEAPDARAAQALAPVRDAAERAVAALPGVAGVSAVLTAHGGPSKAPPPPDLKPGLKIGRHPDPAPAGPQPVAGVDRILAVASGKGGVGKSTVAANLAVALARKGRRVGLLDADIYGPSQPRMMGVQKRPASPDGKTILPLEAHGVRFMSIGLMVDPDKAVVWRGPMLMGALQQMLNQTEWGRLDVLIVDLPPGTGDVQLTLCQRAQVTGALIVSTPQDVALIDARKAIDMFATLKTPVLGLIENMAHHTCERCGHVTHPFGAGGVRHEAERIGVPFLGELPIDLATRVGGDEGRPVAADEGPVAEAFATLADRLVGGGMA